MTHYVDADGDGELFLTKENCVSHGIGRYGGIWRKELVVGESFRIVPAIP